jgi:hypothetical protein
MYEDGTQEWWGAVLGEMFHPGKAGPVTWTLLVGIVVGISLMGRGFWRAFGGFRLTIGRLMVAVLVVALGLAFAPLGVPLAGFSPVVLVLLLLRRPPSRSRSSR